MLFRSRVSLVFLLVCCPAVPVLADTVWLRDGSVLIGTVQRAGEGKLEMETAFAGVIAFDLANIEGITTDAERTLALSSGEQIIGRLTYLDGEQRLLDPLGEEVPVDIAAVTGIWAPGAPDPFLMEDLEEERLSLAELWSGRVEFGLNGQTGNSERFYVRGRGDARRTGERDRLLLYIQGDRSEDDGERSSNELFGGVRYEVDINERWFAFARTELETDEFEDLDLRATVSAGLGYFFIRREHQEFKGRAGLGYVYENFDDGGSENDIIVELGYDYWLEIREWLRFTHALTYFPAVDDPFDEFRAIADTGAEVPLSKEKNWKLRLGMRNEYDNDPEPGIDELDTSYNLSLVYDWN